MGSQHSVEGDHVKSRATDESDGSETVAPVDDRDKNLRETMSESEAVSFDHSRYSELMHALQRVARLQTEASKASVNARQKKREASYKRQDVWIADSNFMKELQRLVALGQLKSFEELSRRAAHCQSIRDGLGPLEQEGADAEQEWEGQVWKLSQAEENLYVDFGHEFRVAQLYPSPTSDSASSHYSSEVETAEYSETPSLPEHADSSIYNPRVGSTASSHLTFDPAFETVVTHHREPASLALLGIGGPDETLPLPSEYLTDSDSGIGDIDEKISTRHEGDLIQLPPAIQRPYHNSVELYPELLTDFVSRRERINKWLESGLLISHLEGDSLFSILKQQLESEDHLVPSNWSQLVIAHWELDGAASPHRRLPSVPEIKTNFHNLSAQAEGADVGPTLTVHHLGRGSAASSNPDHGYFSDNTSKSPKTSREFLVPLRAPPPLPSKLQREGYSVEKIVIKPQKHPP